MRNRAATANEAECYTVSESVLTIMALSKRGTPVTVDDCIYALGPSSIPLALVLFTMLSSLPLFSIPGFTTITGVPIVLLGAQLLCARETIWLPQRIRKHRLKSPRVWKMLQRTLPQIRKAERYLKPRMLILSDKPIRYMLGLAFIIMGVLLALPIPLINFPAGFSMCLLAVGLVERDGVLISLGLTAIFLLVCGVGYVFSTAFAIAGSFS